MSSSNINGPAEIIVSIASVFTGLTIFFYLIPTQVLDPSPVIPNAKTFPYVLAGSFTLLCCRWVFDAVSRNSKQRANQPFPGSLIIGLGIGTVFLFVGYLIGTLGYIIGGIIATSLVIMAIEGSKRWLMSITVSVAINLLFIGFFGKLLNIELPAGILSFF